MADGGPAPGPGDTALANLLLLHGMVMNGGVHHALEVLTTDEVSAASVGFAYFGLNDVAEFLAGSNSNPLLVVWDDDTESEANQRYWRFVPNDSFLVQAFEYKLAEFPDDFAPISRLH